MIFECLCPPDRSLITRSFVDEDLNSEGFNHVSRFIDVEGIEWDEYFRCMPLVITDTSIQYDTVNWKIFVAVFDDGTALLHGTLLEGVPMLLVGNERDWDRAMRKLLPHRLGNTCMDELD